MLYLKKRLRDKLAKRAVEKIYLIIFFFTFLSCISLAKSLKAITCTHVKHNLIPPQKDSLQYILHIILPDTVPSELKKIQEDNQIFTSREKLNTALNIQIESFRKQGFVLANIDSISEKSEPKQSGINKEKWIKVNAYFFPGKMYCWGKFRIIKDSALRVNSFLKKFEKLEGKFVEFSRLNKLEHQLLNSAENQGYPFAQINSDSIRVAGKSISMEIKFSSGRRITFDSLDVQGPSKTKKKFWIKKLGIFPDKVYQEKKIRDIPLIVKKLSFIKLHRKPEVSFYQDRAIIHLRVEDVPSNFFDGIIGFAPSNELEKRIQLTGEVTLGLRNMGGTGKSIDAEWRKTNRYSQELLLGYKHPQFLTPRLEVDIDFSIHKYDTLYNDILRKLTFVQQTGLNTNIRIFGEFFGSRIISTNGLDKNFLPAYTDFDRDAYGIGAEWNNTNDVFYPRKGIFSLLTASAGKKKLVQNTFFNPEVYTEIPATTTTYNYQYKGALFFSPSYNITIKNQLVAGKISADKFFYNDLYRFGGFKTLRGFEEKKFAAEQFFIYTLEVQYYLEENSYLFLFGESGNYKGLTLAGNPVSDTPVGMGAGLSFKTPAGVFSFIYAFGKDKEQPLSLDFSKIHFGFISRF